MSGIGDGGVGGGCTRNAEKGKQGKVFHHANRAKYQRQKWVERKNGKQRSWKGHLTRTSNAWWTSMVMKHWIVIALIIIAIIVIMCTVFVLNLNCFSVVRADSHQPNARFMRSKVKSIAATWSIACARCVCVWSISNRFSLCLCGAFWRHWFKISCNLTQCLFYIKSP